MQHHQSLFSEPNQIVPQPHWAAPDSIGTVTDSVPVHPEGKHPSSDDFKQNNKRKPHTEQSAEEPDRHHPDSDHQIDEYA